MLDSVPPPPPIQARHQAHNHPITPLLQVQYIKRFKKKDVEVLGTEASAQAMREWGERNPTKFIGIVEKQFAEPQGQGEGQAGAEPEGGGDAEGYAGGGRIQGDGSGP